MDIEIAKQQELNTRARDNQNILLNDIEVKEEEDCGLYLGNQKKKSKEIFEFTYRLHMLLPFTILTFVSYIVGWWEGYYIAVIAYNGCVFLCSLLIIIYGHFIYKQSLQ
eukprot:574584_1